MEIRRLENIGFDEVFEGFSNAFSDYDKRTEHFYLMTKEDFYAVHID